MLGPMDWKCKYEVSGLELGIDCVSTAVEILVELSKKEMGETIRFQQARKGTVICTAGQGVSTLSYSVTGVDGDYSLPELRNALAESETAETDLLFVDETQTISTIPSRYVLPILDAVRGIIFILEKEDFPSFLRWSPGH